MEDDNTEISIDAVKRFPCLYAPQNEGYKDFEIKRNAWLEVVKVTGLKDDAAAKIKWKRLRDYYRDCLRKLRTTTGQAAKKYKRWSYMDQMEFLKPSLIHPNTHSNVTPASDEEIEEENEHHENHDNANENRDKETETENVITSRFIPRNHENRKLRNSKKTENVIEDYFKKKMANNDETKSPIDTFFQAISATVKKLPLLSQNRIKMQVSQLVFAEEQNVLQSQVYSESRQTQGPTNRHEFSHLQPQGTAYFQQPSYNQQSTNQQYYESTFNRPQCGHSYRPSYSPALVSDQSESVYSPDASSDNL